MKIIECIQVVLSMLAIGSGAIVLRGVLRVTLSGTRVVRFLEYSLIACVAGLLPLTRHLSPNQVICILSVYCAAAVLLAWRKFHLAGLWRAVFAFLIVAVLYLNVVSLSIQLHNHSLSLETAVTGPNAHFRLVQFFLASAFAALGMFAVRMCHAQGMWHAPQMLYHPAKR
jgi:hypothetical protein